MKWKNKKLPPYGFEIDIDGTLYESDVEQSILKYIFSNKNKTYEEISRILNLKDFQTRQGEEWNRASIQEALKSHRQIIPFLM